jgi:hypothetical protein
VVPFLIVVAPQGALAAVVGSFRPPVPKARVVAACYSATAAVGLLLFSSDALKDHRKRQAETFSDTRDWSAFEAALDPWPFPAPEEALAAVGAACVDDRLPPLEVFTTVALRSKVHPTLLTIVAALCGAEYTRWALAHGGSVVPKHDLAPSPLAYARDDETFKLLRASGATVDQRDAAFPKDATPVFYAYNAAAVRRLRQAGANVFFVDADGNTALHGSSWTTCELWCRTVLARHTDASIVSELLALGLEVDAKNAEGETPLCWHYQDPETLRVFLRHGANPYAKDSYGRPLIENLNASSIAKLRAEGLLPDRPAEAAP